jgi:hypothetical protein
LLYQKVFWMHLKTMKESDLNHWILDAPTSPRFGIGMEFDSQKSTLIPFIIMCLGADGICFKVLSALVVESYW